MQFYLGKIGDVNGATRRKREEQACEMPDREKKKNKRERERRILKEFRTHNLVIYVADGKKIK